MHNFFVMHEFESLEDAINDVFTGCFCKGKASLVFIHLALDASVMHIFLVDKHSLWTQKAFVALYNEGTLM